MHPFEIEKYLKKMKLPCQQAGLPQIHERFLPVCSMWRGRPTAKLLKASVFSLSFVFSFHLFSIYSNPAYIVVNPRVMIRVSLVICFFFSFACGMSQICLVTSFSNFTILFFFISTWYKCIGESSVECSGDEKHWLFVIVDTNCKRKTYNGQSNLVFFGNRKRKKVKKMCKLKKNSEKSIYEKFNIIMINQT